MLFSNWQEVYFTSEMEKFFIAKNLLNERGVLYKTDIINNNLRLSMNNLGNMSPALCRDDKVKDYYKILVKKKDALQAKHLLSGI
ncbi:MAG: hypothetical protein K2K90_12530 [Lachnospiraceae bacterium]|nr:hypothetical protein [Lachnospiraceae bacterium]